MSENSQDATNTPVTRRRRFVPLLLTIIFLAGMWRLCKHEERRLAALKGASTVTTPQAATQSGNPAAPSRPVIQVAQAAHEEHKPNPEASWEVIFPALEKAESDSAAAIDAQIATLDESLKELHSRIPAFAENCLGGEAKIQAAGAAVEGTINAIGELFGEKPSRGDGFRNFVDTSFKQQVLDPAHLRSLIEGVASGWDSADKAFEAKMLVSLNADLDESGLDFQGILTSASPDLAAGDPLNTVIAETTEVVAQDMFIQVAQFTVSWVIGDAVAGQLTNEEDSWLKKRGLDVAVGLAVDGVLDEAVTRAGHNPLAQLTAKVGISLDRMRALIVEGDPDAIEHYDSLTELAQQHIDDSVRRACSEAADVVRTHANLGIRRRLQELHANRCRARKASLSRLVFGVDIPPKEASSIAIPVRLDDATEIQGFARQCIEYYGRASH